MLGIGEELTYEEQKEFIQAALLQGFLSEQAEFPIAHKGRDKSAEALAEALQRCQKLAPDVDLPAGYADASAHAKPIADFDWRKKRGLEKLFETGVFLKDHDHDLLPDTLAFKMILPKKVDTSVMIAACNIAYRFGMETTGINDWLLAESYETGPAILFSLADQTRLYQKAADVLVVEGSGQELEDFSALLCAHFPKLSHFETWTSYLKQLTDDFLLKNLDGQLAYLKAADQPAKAYVSPEFQQRKAALHAAFPTVDFHNYKEMTEIYQKEYELTWEVDEFQALLENEVYPVLQAGDTLELRGAVSENQAVREVLQQKIQQRLANLGISGRIEIVCAHKQGYSWIDECIIPKVKNQKIQKVTLAFRPFLPAGTTEWTEEAGAVPTYNNLNSHDPEKWCDLPIRYLQELYPIQDTLVEKLGITAEQIEFVVYQGVDDVTYECVVEDTQQMVICQESYKASYSERPYLDDYLGMGKVHPPTGRLQVKRNGKLLLEKPVQTDIEKIWSIYQTEILRDCRTFIEKQTKGKPRKAQQPFFSQLKIEVTASEPNQRLNSRNDLLSSLDALHEDMYFVGADYFKNYGFSIGGEMFEEPGLILPVIRQGEGKPTVKVTLYDQMQKEAQILLSDQTIQPTKNREEIALFIRELGYHEGKFTVAIHTEGVCPDVLAGYAALLEAGIVGQTNDFSLIEEVTFEVADQRFSARPFVEEKTQAQDLSIGEIDFYPNQVIGYEKYMEIIRQLKRVPGVAVFPIATSYLGREIYAIEVLPPFKGYLSKTKRLTNHPSEIINARHHANEVSGTNGAFLLLKELLTDPAYQTLPEKLNLVVVPMENVDGAALHYDLQKDNPDWKLHVARFNAVGKEFYYEYFNQETKHPEALGMTRLYEKFVPDVMIDNHGVPTHEWEQPFSGYTSPSYKGFWLPRSLLYGYFWVPSNEEYRSNVQLNKRIEDAIAEAIGQNKEMKRWNVEWAKQFETYAHKWLPKMFPAEYYKEMINYWIYFEEDNEHRYPSIRYPWLTSVAYTSEVADETAQGDYLKVCAESHVVHDLATIDLLLKAQKHYHYHADISAGNINICHTRLRPISV